MTLAFTPADALAIEQKAEEVRRLAARDGAVTLEHLRDETATLQAMIADAARLRRLDRSFDVNGAAVVFPVLLETEEFTGYCLVSNLAPAGMRARVHASFSRQQSIRAHFTSHELIQGTLVWSEGDQVGIRFPQRIDVANVLASPGNIEGERGPHRPARLPVRSLAEISAGKRSQYADVRDISQRGVKVVTRLGRPGEKVEVQVDRLEQRTAVVRWSQAGMAGLSFAKPLSFQELALFGQSASTAF